MPESGVEGVIIALGGNIGGGSPYGSKRKPIYVYNFFGMKRYVTEGAAAIPPGTHQVPLEFANDGGGVAKGGTVSLFIDGEKSGQGRVDQTGPMIFSADETLDIGDDFGAPVTPDFPANGRKFSGEVSWVEIDIGDAAEDFDHFISPEERLNLAMAIQ